MNGSIDWPRKTALVRHRNRRFFALVALVALILFGGRTALSYWVALLWFGSLGYGDVFIRQLALQWGIFAAFAAITFLRPVWSFCSSQPSASQRPSARSRDRLRRAGNESIRPACPAFHCNRRFVVIGLITGGAMASEWPTLALFWFAPRDGSTTVDPIFDKPLNFFLFTLPAWNLIAGWLLTLAVITCLFAGLFILITGGSRAFGERSARYFPLPWHGLSAARCISLVRSRHSHLSRPFRATV